VVTATDAMPWSQSGRTQYEDTNKQTATDACRTVFKYGSVLDGELMLLNYYRPPKASYRSNYMYVVPITRCPRKIHCTTLTLLEALIAVHVYYDLMVYARATLTDSQYSEGSPNM
jgi:hypothetical protein